MAKKRYGIENEEIKEIIAEETAVEKTIEIETELTPIVVEETAVEKTTETEAEVNQVAVEEIVVEKTNPKEKEELVVYILNKKKASFVQRNGILFSLTKNINALTKEEEEYFKDDIEKNRIVKTTESTKVMIAKRLRKK